MSDENGLICKVCEKPCKSPAGLGAHLKKAHNIDPSHGTVGMYLKHRRNGEEACRDCKAAWSRNARAAQRRK